MTDKAAPDTIIVEANEGGDYAVAAAVAANPTARVIRVYRTHPASGRPHTP